MPEWGVRGIAQPPVPKKHFTKNLKHGATIGFIFLSALAFVRGATRS